MPTHHVLAMISEYDRQLAKGYPVPWWAEQQVLREPSRPELGAFLVYTWKEPGEDARRYIKYPLAAFQEISEFGSVDPVCYIPDVPLQAPKPTRFFVMLTDDWWFVIDARQKTVEYQGLDEELARLVAAKMAREFGNDRWG